MSQTHNIRFTRYTENDEGTEGFQNDPRSILIFLGRAEGVRAQVGRVEEGAGGGQVLPGEDRCPQVRRGDPGRQVPHSRTRGLLIRDFYILLFVISSI